MYNFNTKKNKFYSSNYKPTATAFLYNSDFGKESKMNLATSARGILDGLPFRK